MDFTADPMRTDPLVDPDANAPDIDLFDLDLDAGPEEPGPEKPELRHGLGVLIGPDTNEPDTNGPDVELFDLGLDTVSDDGPTVPRPSAMPLWDRVNVADEVAAISNAVAAAPDEWSPALPSTPDVSTTIVPPVATSGVLDGLSGRRTVFKPTALQRTRTGPSGSHPPQADLKRRYAKLSPDDKQKVKAMAVLHDPDGRRARGPSPKVSEQDVNRLLKLLIPGGNNNAHRRLVFSEVLKKRIFDPN